MRETEEQKPALRISHIVYGRESRGNRVVYLVDPKGRGEDKDIPETVVLRRWRMRRFPGHVFGGCRLSPNLWRAIPLVFGDNADKICSLDERAIESGIERARAALKSKKYKVPSAECLRAIFAVLGPDRLRQLVDRHTSTERQGRYGIPDLFLYAKKTATGLPSGSRFVEVKKPEENISADQIEEIDFLNRIGLHARVLRLIERG